MPTENTYPREIILVNDGGVNGEVWAQMEFLEVPQDYCDQFYKLMEDYSNLKGRTTTAHTS